MVYVATDSFKADGVQYTPGKPVPNSVFRGGALGWMLGQGLVADVPAEFAGEHAPPHTDAALRRANELGVSLSTVEGTGAEGQVTVEDVESAAEEQHKENASDEAVKKAEELEVDLTDVEGTGDGGRILVEDVERTYDELQEPDATDAAKRKAAALEVDLKDVEPYASGAKGEIIVGDVEQYAKEHQEGSGEEDESEADEE